MSSAHTHDLPEHRSNWARTGRTTLRDAARLRFDVEQHIEKIIAAAQLTAPLAQVVRRISNDTRLLYDERLAVAEELAAHFADGVDAGESPEQLAKDFGDDAQASKLIRRAQRRKRTGPRRYIILSGKIAGICLLLLLCIYAYLAVRFFFASPSPSHDYLADLNKSVVATPADNHAWPRYREALLMLEEPPMMHSVRTPMPGEPGWEQLADYLRQVQPAMERFALGASKPILGYEYNFGVHAEDAAIFPGSTLASELEATDEPRTLIGVLLPHAAVLRAAAAMIGDDVRRAVADGDLNAAARNLEALLGMATQLLEGPTLIEQLVGYSIAIIAADRFGEISTDTPWTSQQLARIDDALARFGGNERIITNIAGERHMFMDVIQHTYTDDGKGDGRLTWSGVQLLEDFTNFSNLPERDEWLEDAVTSAMMPAMSAVAASRKQVVDKYDELLAELQAEGAQPNWKRDAQFDHKLEQMIRANRWEYYPIAVLMPAISSVFKHADQITMRRDGMRITIAAMQYRNQHGTWPQSLDAMIPAVLDQAPVDQYTGKPLGYALRDGQPVVYSVGNDGDDDAGRPAKAQKYARWSPHSRRWAGTEQGEGDWILWPLITPPSDLEYDEDQQNHMYALGQFTHEGEQSGSDDDAGTGRAPDSD